MDPVFGFVMPAIAAVVTGCLVARRVGGARPAALASAALVFMGAVAYFDDQAHRPGNEDMLGLPESIILNALIPAGFGAASAVFASLRRSRRAPVAGSDRLDAAGTA